MSLYIAGTGRAVPDLIITNEDMAKVVETSDEWIVTRTGIKQRRFVSNVALTELAVTAANRAIDNAAIEVDQIDMVIGATMSGDYVTPSLACLVQGALGAKGIALDVNAACTGFLYALDMAQAYFDSNKATTALIVCAEQMSKYLDFADRSTCVLFGDGAAAVVVRKGDGLKYIKISAIGDKTHLNITGNLGGVPEVLGGIDVPAGEGRLAMNGQEIFRFAVSTSTRELNEMLNASGVTADEIGCYVLHQANRRIVDAVAMALKVDKARLPHNMDKYGNTSCVSIPLLLDELNQEGRLTDGMLVAMSAFGAGLTSGAALIRWGASARVLPDGQMC